MTTITEPTHTASHTYASGGIKTVTVVATGTGGTASLTKTVNVATDHPPVPVLAVTGTTGAATITWDTAGTTDPDGDPITLSTSFGDGSAASTAASGTHTYTPSSYPASYTIATTATAGGVSATTTRTWVVTDPAAPIGRATLYIVDSLGRDIPVGGQVALVAAGSGIDYTGTLNSTSALQTLLNAASADAVSRGPWTVATVVLLPGVLKLTGLTLPAQVALRGEGTRITSVGSGAVITTAGDYWRISQVEFGGGGSGVAGVHAIVVPSGSTHGLIEHVRFNNFSGRAILLSAGSLACSVTEVFAQNCLLNTASLSAKTGVLEIAGNDHHVYGNVEVTASRTSLSSANAYACGVAVTGASNFLEQTLAETSDVGFYLSADNNLLSQCRADLNRTHGFEIAGGDGVMSSCLALNNSLETTNTYDGFYATTGNWILSECLAVSSATEVHRYGFNDTQDSDTVKNWYSHCHSLGHGTRGFQTAGFAGASVSLPSHPRVTRSSATPSVDQCTQVKLNNVSATTVTNFTGGVSGQSVIVWGDGQSTIQHGGSILLKGAANHLLASNETMTLCLHNGTWFEI